MKTKLLTLCSIILFAALLAACGTASPSAAGTPAAGTPAAAAQRTPGTPRNPGAQSTAQPANGANTGAPAAQATPQPTAASGASGAAAAPTAITAPVIVMPTAVPAVTASPAAVDITPAKPAPVSPAVPPAAQPQPTAAPTLQSLKGKIVFFSDRAGYAQLYVMNADGSNQQLCSCSDLLPSLVNTEVTSPDKLQFLFVKTVGAARANNTEIWRHNTANNTDYPVTGGAPGFPGVDYNPAWSPDSKSIAWVSEANGFDEIYLYNATQNSNVRLTQSSGEWYKHPTFSPDGSHIAFWTNLGNLNYKQVWSMNLDGSAKVNLSNNSYNDWDPIWVK